MTAEKVSSTASLKNAVVRKLTELGREGVFFTAHYGDDGLPQEINQDEDKPAHPSSVVANDITAGFEADANFGRAIAQHRISWMFELHLGFDRATVLELFETLLMNPVPIVTVTGLPSVALRLVEATYEHPPRQQASSGTTVVYTFNATAGRI